MKLHTKILIGLVSGAVVGIAVNQLAADALWVAWLQKNVAAPMGQIFLRLLLMTVVPLVFVSIALGVANMGDVRQLGRIGAKTLGYFLLSTSAAVVIGLTLVNVIRPGDGLDEATRTLLLESHRASAQGMQAGGATEFGVSTFVNIIPRNPVAAAANMDMLSIIFVALCFGAALTTLPRPRADLLVKPMEVIGDIIIMVIEFAMRLAPYGVFALIWVATSQFGYGLLQKLFWYVLVVLLGLGLHATVSLSLFVRFIGGLRPLVFWKKARPSLVTAFSTSSSSATLPTNIAVAEKDLKVPPHIAGFVLPLGATMNMNGTSLFEGVTVLFLAQVFGVDLTLGQQLIVVILSVVTAVGAAGVPGGSLPLLMLVLGTVGVPPESIAIVLGIDRILDMCRTTLNVAGDLSASVCVARSEGVWSAQDVT